VQERDGRAEVGIVWHRNRIAPGGKAAVYGLFRRAQGSEVPLVVFDKSDIGS
jgi:hypothetical protein